jgi:hypothetical protein
MGSAGHVKAPDTAYLTRFSRKAQEVQGTHEYPQEIGNVGHPVVLPGKRTQSATISCLWGVTEDRIGCGGWI